MSHTLTQPLALIHCFSPRTSGFVNATGSLPTSQLSRARHIQTADTLLTLTIQYVVHPSTRREERVKSTPSVGCLPLRSLHVSVSFYRDTFTSPVHSSLSVLSPPLQPSLKWEDVSAQPHTTFLASYRRTALDTRQCSSTSLAAASFADQQCPFLSLSRRVKQLCSSRMRLR